MNSREVVLAWHAALNAGDIDRLLALSSEDVEVGGPRGVSRGQQVLRDWFGRAGVTLEPLRLVEGAETVVVEQRATWPGSEPQIVASAFDVRAGRVSRVVRYGTLSEAIEAEGLVGLLPGP